VRPTGEVASFCGGHPLRAPDDARDVHFFAAEFFEQRAAAMVSTHNSDGENFSAEIGKVIDGICGAAGIVFGFAMTKDQDRSFAGDARDVASNKLIEDEIADDADGLLRKRRYKRKKSRQIDGLGLG
jgi:hypothetical protein